MAHRVLIKFKSPPSAAELSAVRDTASAVYLQPIGGAGWYKLDSPSLPAAQLITKLAADAAVAKVEPDYVGKPMGVVPARPSSVGAPHMFDMPNDPYYTSQWAFSNTGQCILGTCGQPGDDINAEAAWTIGKGSSTIVIASFDTGIDYNNPDLGPNVWSAPYAYTITEGGNVYNCPQGSHGINVVDNQSGCAGQELDTSGHGTLTSGVADAVTNNNIGVAGTAWNVPIISIRMCVVDWCDSATAITAIDAALQIERQFGLRIVAGNMSEGNLSGSAMADEMSLAGQSNLLFSVSTGNEGRAGADDPASFYLPNEIAVAGSGQSNYRASWQGGSSNGGGNIVAPGERILTTAMGDPSGGSPQVWSGTSLSAPFVTGAIALLESTCPNLSPSAVIPTLEGTADQIVTLSYLAPNGALLNLGNALASCASGTPGTDTATVSMPRRYPLDTGTVVINIAGQQVASYSYDNSVDTGATIAQGLVDSFGSQYAIATYGGAGTIHLTTTALGPYTGYTANAQVFDDCQPGDGCGPPPQVRLYAFLAGHN